MKRVLVLTTLAMLAGTSGLTIALQSAQAADGILTVATIGEPPTLDAMQTPTDIVLITSRTQTYEPDIFANQGIDFAKKSYLLVKSTNHFHAGFQPVSSEIVYIAAPTSYPTDPATTPYRTASLELWPRVADPLGLES